MTCKRCGACCKIVAFDLPGLKDEPDYINYYKTRGFKVEGDRIIVPTRCPHLTADNLCDINDTKPIQCKQWDGKNDKREGVYIPPECQNE